MPDNDKTAEVITALILLFAAIGLVYVAITIIVTVFNAACH